MGFASQLLRTVLWVWQENLTVMSPIPASNEPAQEMPQLGPGSSSEEYAAQTLDSNPPETGKARKNERVRQKNRVAQKRFRQRTKERMDTLHADVEELSRKLQQVEFEKQRIEADMSLLRSQQMGASSSGVSRPLPNLKEAEVEFVPSVSWAGFNPAAKGSIILRAMFDTPRRLTFEQALKLSISDHCRIWQEVVYQCGKLLLDNPGEDSEHIAGRQLQELLSERRGLCCYFSCWVPSILPILQSMDMSNPHLESPALPSGEFHTRVMEKLDLSVQQKEKFRKAYQSMNVKLEEIFREREELQKVVQGLEVSMVEAEVSCPLQNMSLRLKQTVRQLQENIEAEHVAICTLWAAILVEPDGMTYFQEAKFLLSSWPFFPDPAQLYFQICQDVGEEPGAVHDGRMTQQTLVKVKKEEGELCQPQSCPTESASASLLRSFVAEDVSSQLYDVERSKGYLTIAS